MCVCVCVYVCVCMCACVCVHVCFQDNCTCFQKGLECEYAIYIPSRGRIQPLKKVSPWL